MNANVLSKFITKKKSDLKELELEIGALTIKLERAKLKKEIIQEDIHDLTGSDCDIVVTDSDLKKAISEIKPMEYDPNWPLSGKVLYGVKIANKFSKIHEIITNVVGIEKKINPTIDQKEFYKKLYNASVGLRQANKITKILPKGATSHQSAKWGLPDWLDERGNPKEGRN